MASEIEKYHKNKRKEGILCHNFGKNLMARREEKAIKMTRHIDEELKKLKNNK